MPQQILVLPELREEYRKKITAVLNGDEKYKVQFLTSAGGEPAERKLLIEKADAILAFNMKKDLRAGEFSLLRHIRFLQLISAGADHLPYQKIPDSVTLASNAGAYARPMAEHVLAMALSLAKRLPEEHKNMKKGEFNQFESVSKSIADSTIGILGFGGIGQASARLFRAFGARIFAMNTSGETDIPVDFIGTQDDLKQILQRSDIIVLSLPLKNSTHEMIGETQLQWMKKDAILINVARGEIVKQKDLYEHLRQHPEFKAGVDSWWVEPARHGSFELEYPFLDLPNVLASPHNSSMVPGIRGYALEEAAKNIRAFLEGKPYKGKIDRSEFV